MDVDWAPGNGFQGLDSEDVTGVARRRRPDSGGFIDEFLRHDFTWSFTDVIVRWKHGESPDVVELTPEQADRLIERFRTEWDS
jgi:hypothetical protein